MLYNQKNLALLENTTYLECILITYKRCLSSCTNTQQAPRNQDISYWISLIVSIRYKGDKKASKETKHPQVRRYIVSASTDLATLFTGSTSIVYID